MKSSLAVANHFVELADSRGDTLTPMQLLKLVYIAHGWMLGLHGRPLIRDEIQAWQYGPVIPKLYNALKSYRSNPVIRPLKSLEAQDGDFDAAEREVIAQVFDLYGGYSGPDLSRITHADNTPWTKTYVPAAFGTIISNDLIEDHYRKLSERL